MIHSLHYLRTFVLILSAVAAYAQGPIAQNTETQPSKPTKGTSGQQFENAKLEPLPFNTAGDEFSINFTQEAWYFTGERGVTGAASLDIYRIAVTGLQRGADLFSKKINSHKDEGVFALYDQCNQLIFGRNESRDPAVSRMKLYQSKRDLAKGKWNKPTAIVLGPESFAYAHPVVSPDGRTLYFASNMTGTVGGADIFKSQWRDGNWSTPLHLGDEVNTAGDEFPSYVDREGNLWFASNGHDGQGGFDVFRAINGDEYQVISYGAPVNRPANDFGMVEYVGDFYFASSREGGRGRNDLY